MSRSGRRQPSGPVRVEKREIAGHDVWVAEDDLGVVAMSTDRDVLVRSLQEEAAIRHQRSAP